MIYDIIVIGGGPGGYLAAERAGHAGLKVLCIEERSLGGVCLNEGCIPTKSLLYSAKLYDGAMHGDKYGITVGNVSIDHSKVVERKDKVVKTLVQGVGATLKANKVEVVYARGSIKSKDNDSYVVEAGGTDYKGNKIIIATGSSPAVPPIPGLKEGLESGFVLTNREILDIKECPKKLAIIGGGVIGLELASYYNSIGSEVTVIEMLDHIAGENDADLIKILQKNYEKKGVKFLLSAKVIKVDTSSIHYEKDGKQEVVSADKVLLSIGRRANITGIGIESINVMVDRGAIVTDKHLRTNQPEVYAVGDVNGKSMLAHTAYREAEVAINTILGKRDYMRYNAIPGVIYTNPELGAVGETEATAIAKGIDVGVVKLPMQYSGRYVAENEGGNGIFKLVVNNKTKEIVGAAALCNYASEFIIAVGTFIEARLTIDEIKEIVFPHPTVCEIIREAAFQYKG